MQKVKPRNKKVRKERLVQPPYLIHPKLYQLFTQELDEQWHKDKKNVIPVCNIENYEVGIELPKDPNLCEKVKA